MMDKDRDERGVENSRSPGEETEKHPQFTIISQIVLRIILLDTLETAPSGISSPLVLNRSYAAVSGDILACPAGWRRGRCLLPAFSRGQRYCRASVMLKSALHSRESFCPKCQQCQVENPCSHPTASDSALKAQPSHLYPLPDSLLRRQAS